jgi:hypothetical protein
VSPFYIRCSSCVARGTICAEVWISRRTKQLGDSTLDRPPRPGVYVRHGGYPVDVVNVSALSELGKLDLAKKFAANLRDSLPKELHAASFTLNSKFPFKATSFREFLIHRMSDIADVTVDLYENNRIVPAFIMTRSLIETTALLSQLHRKSCEFLETADEEAYDEFLMKGIGSKDKSTEIDSQNILTAMNRLDSEFEGLRKMYDTLCEFTHPNWSGSMGSYSKLHAGKYTLHLGKEHANPPLAFGLVPLIAGFVIFQDHYNELSTVLKAINDKYDHIKTEI